MQKWHVILAFVCLPSSVMAELSTAQWPIIERSHYGERTITPTTRIQLKAPLGAENAAQVPLTLSVDNAFDDPIVDITVFVDANPFPLVAQYVFPLAFKQLSLSTRLRMESDSHIRAIGQTKSGALLMATTVVNAGGGCAGEVADDKVTTRARAGEMKFQQNAPFKINQIASATLQIRHPMHTGLQTDATTKHIKPAFFIENAIVLLDQERVLEVKFGVGTAENPYLKFSFDLPQVLHAKHIEAIKIQANDNEGQSFSALF